MHVYFIIVKMDRTVLLQSILEFTEIKVSFLSHEQKGCGQAPYNSKSLSNIENSIITIFRWLYALILG